ncbi:MAG: HNH endonuclease [Nostoc sp.]
MNDYQWEKEVKEWLFKHKKNLKSDLEQDFITFFEYAFINTYDPEQAWFGIHREVISLVLGGIFLAAVHLREGIWLLVDQDQPEVYGLEYQPVKSTLKYEAPLIWAYADSFDIVSIIIENSDIWKSYAKASEKILNYGISSPRDSIQKSRLKKRLSDFWIANSSKEKNGYLQALEEKVRRSQLISKVERSERLKKAHKTPETIQITQIVFKRNADVIAEVLDRANGICEACRSPAPFIRASDGTPYLEVHHKKLLAEGGDDTVDNAIAVCPNCHRKAHYG